MVNDDLVKPSEGFDTHPHSNMEIISYVIQGGLTHKDSMGTKETLHRGSVQYMRFVNTARTQSMLTSTTALAQASHTQSTMIAALICSAFCKYGMY